MRIAVTPPDDDATFRVMDLLLVAKQSRRHL